MGLTWICGKRVGLSNRSGVWGENINGKSKTCTMVNVKHESFKIYFYLFFLRRTGAFLFLMERLHYKVFAVLKKREELSPHIHSHIGRRTFTAGRDFKFCFLFLFSFSLLALFALMPCGLYARHVMRNINNKKKRRRKKNAQTKSK